MARRPADYRHHGRYEQNRQTLWNEIRVLQTFTSTDLERVTAMHRSSINTYLNALEAAGFIERDQPPKKNKGPGLPFEATVWTLIKDNGIHAPKVNAKGEEVAQGKGRQNMWRTMKMMKSFTHRDLAIRASTDDCVIKETEAKSYVLALHKAEYLVRIKKGGPGKLAVYRLLASKNTGPKSPQVMRVKAVFDANLNQVVWDNAGGAR